MRAACALCFGLRDRGADRPPITSTNNAAAPYGGSNTVTADVKEAGVQLRRDIFGAEFTDRQIEQANAFLRPMQDVVSQYCFGETWSRPGLTLRERSMITLAALCAMGRSAELRVHVIGALANGVTPLEVRELLLHTMVYAGVPLGAHAMITAAEVLAERGVDLDRL